MEEKCLKLEHGICMVGEFSWRIWELNEKSHFDIEAHFTSTFSVITTPRIYSLMIVKRGGREIWYGENDRETKAFWNSFQAKKLLYEFLVNFWHKAPDSCSPFEIDVVFNQLIEDKFKPNLLRDISHNLSVHFHPRSSERIYRAICALLGMDFDKYVP